MSSPALLRREAAGAAAQASSRCGSGASSTAGADGAQSGMVDHFVSDSLEYARRLKCLTIVDDFSKESVDIVVDHGISGLYVTRVLDRAVRFRGRPLSIRTHQAPGFTAKDL